MTTQEALKLLQREERTYRDEYYKHFDCGRDVVLMHYYRGMKNAMASAICTIKQIAATD